MQDDGRQSHLSLPPRGRAGPQRRSVTHRHWLLGLGLRASRYTVAEAPGPQQVKGELRDGAHLFGLGVQCRHRTEEELQMGCHLETFKKIIDACPEELRHAVLLSCTLALEQHPISKPSGPDIGEWSLKSLREQEMRSRTKLKDLPDFPQGTWEEVADCIDALAALGVSEGFIVTSLVEMMDANLHYYADEAEFERGLANERRALEEFKRKKADDSPENAAMWDHVMEPFMASRSNPRARLEEARENLQVWRRIASDRLAMHRINGLWPDCIDRMFLAGEGVVDE